MRTPRGDEALRVAWLGEVDYQLARSIQRLLWSDRAHEYLLLLEHPPVYTMGIFAKPDNLLRPPHIVGAKLVKTDRGGDITYHGPGQLVGYPILDVPRSKGSNPAHVHSIEQVIIDVLFDLGVTDATRKAEYPGVWVNDRKICAVGVRVSRERSMHGFALNVDPDMRMFQNIVPCGIREFGVTSLAQEGVHPQIPDLVNSVADLAARVWDREIVRFDIEGLPGPEATLLGVSVPRLRPSPRGS